MRSARPMSSLASDEVGLIMMSTPGSRGSSFQLLRSPGRVPGSGNGVTSPARRASAACATPTMTFAAFFTVSCGKTAGQRPSAFDRSWQGAEEEQLPSRGSCARRSPLTAQPRLRPRNGHSRVLRQPSPGRSGTFAYAKVPGRECVNPSYPRRVPIGHDLARFAVRAECRREEPSRARMSGRGETDTSMMWPHWSIAR
jgi:hypothetical protein